MLFDVTPRQLLDIAGEHFTGRYRGALKRYRYGPGVFKVDFALDGPIPWSAPGCSRAGTVHLGGTLDEIAVGEAAVWRNQHPERQFVLLAQQSLFDPTRAPDGKHTVWAYVHVPNGSTVDMTGRIEAQIERFAPGFRDRILARSSWGPADLERQNANLVGGDITGGAMDLQSAPRSARGPAEPLRDLRARALPLLLLDPAGGRRARAVRLSWPPAPRCATSKKRRKEPRI